MTMSPSSGCCAQYRCAQLAVAWFLSHKLARALWRSVLPLHCQLHRVRCDSLDVIEFTHGLVELAASLFIAVTAISFPGRPVGCLGTTNCGRESKAVFCHVSIVHIGLGRIQGPGVGKGRIRGAAVAPRGPSGCAIVFSQRHRQAAQRIVYRHLWPRPKPKPRPGSRPLGPRSEISLPSRASVAKLGR